MTVLSTAAGRAKQAALVGFAFCMVSHGLQLQSLCRIPTAAVR